MPTCRRDVRVAGCEANQGPFVIFVAAEPLRNGTGALSQRAKEHAWFLGEHTIRAD